MILLQCLLDLLANQQTTTTAKLASLNFVELIFMTFHSYSTCVIYWSLLEFKQPRGRWLPSQRSIEKIWMQKGAQTDYVYYVAE